MSRASSGFFFFRIKVFPVNWYGSSLHHLTTELEIRSCSPIWLLMGPLRAGAGSIIYSFRCLSYCQWQSQDAQLCFYCGVNLQLTVTASSHYLFQQISTATQTQLPKFRLCGSFKFRYVQHFVAYTATHANMHTLARQINLPSVPDFSYHMQPYFLAG